MTCAHKYLSTLMFTPYRIIKLFCTCYKHVYQYPAYRVNSHSTNIKHIVSTILYTMYTHRVHMYTHVLNSSSWSLRVFACIEQQWAKYKEKSLVPLIGFWCGICATNAHHRYKCIRRLPMYYPKHPPSIQNLQLYSNFTQLQLNCGKISG